MPSYSFCRMSNNTMATVSNLCLARGYVIFVKFYLLTAMTVKVLTSLMWTFCFHFQGRKIKKDLVFSSETLICCTDLHGTKSQKKFISSTHVHCFMQVVY